MLPRMNDQQLHADLFGRRAWIPARGPVDLEDISWSDALGTALVDEVDLLHPDQRVLIAGIDQARLEPLRHRRGPDVPGSLIWRQRAGAGAGGVAEAQHNRLGS